MPSEQPQVIVLGGRSMVGTFLLQRLVALGYRGLIASRGSIITPPHFTRLATQDIQAPGWQAPAGAIVLSLLPIWLLAPLLGKFAHAAQVIAISSTSIFGKANSADPYEQRVVAMLAEGEAAVRNCAVPYTILRPTLIYDGEHDQNILTVARLMKRCGFFPVAGRGQGLRQPVHADDVAAAMMACIGNALAMNRDFNITGGTAMPYTAMLARIAEGLGQTPRVISLPGWLLKLLLRGARAAKLTALSPSLFDRMNEDLAFDDLGAAELLGLSPRPFRPRFPRL